MTASLPSLLCGPPFGAISRLHKGSFKKLMHTGERIGRFRYDGADLLNWLNKRIKDRESFATALCIKCLLGHLEVLEGKAFSGLR